MSYDSLAEMDFGAMLRDISIGRLAAESRLTLSDGMYALAVERAAVLSNILGDEMGGLRAHHVGCLCPYCKEHGPSFIVAVEPPKVERPYERHRIGMFNWWKFVAIGKDLVEWRWSMDDVGTAGNYARFRKWFSPAAGSGLPPLDIPICHVTPYFCADNPSLYFYDRRTGFEFDAKKEAMKSRHFNGSGRLAVVKRGEPLLLAPDASPSEAAWLQAELSLATDVASDAPTLEIAIDPEQTRKWPDLFHPKRHVLQSSDVEQLRTLHVRHDERYFPLARLIEVAADGTARFELDETVRLVAN